MDRDLKKLIGQMTLEEKAGLCSGADFWHTKAVERLGIPSVMVSDGPHGLRKQEDKADHLGINDSIRAVCFPPACLSACSFDRGLMHEFGETIGCEAQAENVSVVLGPAVNIKRSPLCGRNFEYYSEDPYLAGEVAASFIQGVQEHHAGTSIKHFAANNQEFNRMSCSSEVDEQTLREIYLPAFEKAVKTAQPKTVMCSYNRLNGTYASENEWLLTKVLREEWGFEGYVMSDWGAVNDRVKALKAGLELEMPASGGMNDAEIVRAVESGELDEAVLDRACERFLKVVYDWADHRENRVLELEKDHAEAQKIAEQSMVLLRNEDRILPLSETDSIAVIGEFAKKPRFQGGGSSHINAFRVDSAWDSLCEAGLKLTYAEGYPADRDLYDAQLAAEAIKTAAGADKAIIFAGLPDSFESEGYDRAHMRLPDCQNRLIEEIVKVQPNTVVILHNGSPVEMPWRNRVKGILETYLGGQAGGKAVARILTGEVNPSGKLAETMPVKLSDNPSWLNFGDGDEVRYAEGCFVGYRYYDKKEMEVAFPFGHGLSYTTFAYSNMKICPDETGWLVTLDVTNTGPVAGSEIVQLYVAGRTGSSRVPVRELKGFEKIALQPGETGSVALHLNRRSFSGYSCELHDWYAADGTYEVQVGASSRDIRLTAKVTLTGAPRLPLHLHLNSTMGEMIRDPRSRDFGIELKRRMDAFFNGGEEVEEKHDEAVTDEMSLAIVGSMPIRNVLTFGLIAPDELQKKLDELNSLS